MFRLMHLNPVSLSSMVDEASLNKCGVARPNGEVNAPPFQLVQRS